MLILGFVFGALVAGVMLLGTPGDFPVLFEYRTHSGEMDTYQTIDTVFIDTGLTSHSLIGLYVAFLLGSLMYFIPKFAAPEDRTGVDEFYKDLDTPVDVATEVTGSAEAAISVFKLVGVLTFVVAGLVALLGVFEQAFVPDRRSEWWKYAALIGILAFVGLASYLLLN